MDLQESFHILAGWLVDGSGGPRRHRVLLRIAKGVFTSLDPGVGADLPTTGLLDLSHCTIIPGLVDAHVHLCMSGSADPRVRQQQVRKSLEQARTLIATHLADHVAHGIMAVRDGGDYAAHALRFKESRLPDARWPLEVRCCGQAWHALGRYGRFIGAAPASGERLDEAVRRGEARVDQLKVIHSGVNSLVEFGRPTAPQFPFIELRAAVAEAAVRGLKTMIHANGLLPVQEALDAGCHSVEHGYFMGRKNLEKLAQYQVAWVPTVVPMASYARDMVLSHEEVDVAHRTVEHQLEQLRTAKALGVNVVLGTDSGALGVEHGKAVTQELRLLADAGYSVEEALQCATSRAAALLGIRDRLGLVAPGRPASFVVVEGPPTELFDRLTTPHSVWVRGQMVRCKEEERKE
jgi:imidazolonepropionase-like amidohydrolase